MKTEAFVTPGSQLPSEAAQHRVHHDHEEEPGRAQTGHSLVIWHVATAALMAAIRCGWEVKGLPDVCTAAKAEIQLLGSSVCLPTSRRQLMHQRLEANGL